MASIKKTRLKNGDWSYKIVFYLHGRQHILSLGRGLTVEKIREIRSQVERLTDCVQSGTEPRRSLATWLEEIPGNLRAKLLAAGLIPGSEDQEQSGPLTVGGLWQIFISDSDQIGRGQRTLSNYNQAEKRFLSYFSSASEVGSITEIEAEKYKAYLLRDFSVSTVANSLAITKTCFAHGIRKRLIAENPFSVVKKGTYRNPTRQQYIPIEWYEPILDACPSSEWRVLWSMARIGGLRIPSEAFALTWRDVNWDRKRVRITSSKTARYEGHAQRWSPLWPELYEELERLYFDSYPSDKNELRDDFVLPGLRRRFGDTGNPGHAFKATILQAGYEPWPKTWINCRASRDTELKRCGFTADQRSAWLGHTEAISVTYYQIESELCTDADFDRASCFRISTCSGKQRV